MVVAFCQISKTPNLFEPGKLRDNTDSIALTALPWASGERFLTLSDYDDKTTWQFCTGQHFL